ncbi:hypothetical protein NEOLEDRAFT_1126628 [Neolentinus lepideus HHB14362 ss-1]|uniref:Uncharacterized protein n=1 Tax=Neolentinus lepideus HHB14362 ss-1 TaxID=1314782 RepID=A0A165WBF2_9AGAM|nr:hypothetical protein NEOLEDRAFT_1126628 [Neolentinus lepideus HHB14362 ss-1]
MRMTQKCGERTTPSPHALEFVLLNNALGLALALVLAPAGGVGNPLLASAPSTSSSVGGSLSLSPLPLGLLPLLAGGVPGMDGGKVLLTLAGEGLVADEGVGGR